MLLLRQLTPLVRFQTNRLYAKKAGATANVKNVNKMKQVHQETMRRVDTFACVKIRSDIYLKVCTADVHKHPDGDYFNAQLHGGHVKNCPASMKVEVSDDDKEVTVEIVKIAGSAGDFHCEVELPIKADLHIVAKEDVKVKNIFGKTLTVTTDKNIFGKNLRADKLSLTSENGRITSEGLLLAQEATVETKQTGSIYLDKLQGDKLHCKTKQGSITTNSCYVEFSKFETDDGDLFLKNMHKKSVVVVHNKAAVNMTGVHGNFYVHTNGGTMDLQLSEIEGENIIVAENIDSAMLNISDSIEENSYIEITAEAIKLDDSLSHLVDCITDNEQKFRMSRERDNQKKLMASIRGEVKLGKQSWADSMRAAIGLADK